MLTAAFKRMLHWLYVLQQTILPNTCIFILLHITPDLLTHPSWPWNNNGTTELLGRYACWLICYHPLLAMTPAYVFFIRWPLDNPGHLAVKPS
jgi:hypothetical protein